MQPATMSTPTTAATTPAAPTSTRTPLPPIAAVNPTIISTTTIPTIPTTPPYYPTTTIPTTPAITPATTIPATTTSTSGTPAASGSPAATGTPATGASATSAPPTTTPTTSPTTTSATQQRRRRSPDLTRDQRLQCLTLRGIGWSYQKIAQQLGCTERQVQTACQAGHPSPKKRTGRPPKLTEEQVKEIEAFVGSSRSNRLLSYKKLARGPFARFGVGEDAIQHALEARGFKRTLRRGKRARGGEEEEEPREAD